MTWNLGAALFLCLGLAPASLRCEARGSAAPRYEPQHSKLQKKLNTWQKSVQSNIYALHRYGAGGYSTDEQAKSALKKAFSWHEQLQQPVFDPLVARPSFCSGAVYAVVLSSLAKWERTLQRRIISPESWQALLPRDNKDGEGAWGWANANGPGFAMLVRQLGAGYSFTDIRKAQPADILKIWWNEEIGHNERGHLVIYDRDCGESIRVWSSNRASGNKAGGYGLRTYPKSEIKRMLFTRITNPAAFNKAPTIGRNDWLHNLLYENTTWQESLKRSGVQEMFSPGAAAATRTTSMPAERAARTPGSASSNTTHSSAGTPMRSAHNRKMSG